MAGSLPHAACGGVLLVAVKLEIAFVERRGASHSLCGPPVPALEHCVLEE